MKVFVSWSGDASRIAADALNTWLPTVFQGLEVFFSAKDIDKGARWFSELDKRLNESSFAILCLTPENVRKPWILYEAGAVSKSFEKSRVVPLLLGMKLSDLPSPLDQFNAAVPSKQDIRALVGSINKARDRQLADTLLDTYVDRFWMDIEGPLNQAVARAGKAEYDVFLSTPMAGFDNDADYQSARREMLKVFNALEQTCGFNVFWAAKDIETIHDFDTVDVSAEQDIRALERSRCFILIYPRKLHTSALFEAGYALAKELNCHYFVRERRDLPFLMREIPGPFDGVRIHGQDGWEDYDDLAAKVVRYKDQWFG